VSSLTGGPAAAAAGPQLVEAQAGASPPWLADRRRAAWDAFQALPMPSSRSDEDWRRTDISKLHLESFAPIENVDESTVEAMRAQRDRGAPKAAFAIDAPVAAPRIEDSDTLVAQGLIITTLEEAAIRHPELVQRGLSSMSVGESKFIALWNAMWRGGIFVYVPAGAEARVPVWIAHPATGDDASVYPATVIVLDDGAALTVVDAYASPAGDTSIFSDAVVAITAGRDARIDYCSLQQWGGGVWHVALQRAVLGANARLRFFGATLGSRLQKAYWETILDGPGAEADICGVAFGDGVQHLDHQSLQAHRARDTRSDLLLKVAVRDQARSVYSGLIDVAPEAVHADGYVQNRNLLLSHGAKADSVPRLEIRANDVRCGHGATAGHLDADQRFYLMARGVTRHDADALIVRAFLEDAVGRSPHPGFAEVVASLLEAEIAGRPQAGIAEEA